MKKRLLYMLVVLGGIFSGSCESYLEEVPQNKLKPNTTDDYDQLLNYGYLTEQVVPYLDILSDDVDLIASDHSMEGDDYGDVYVAAYMWNKDIETTMPGGVSLSRNSTKVSFMPMWYWKISIRLPGWN